ncbi:MAG: hypothetical protein PVJ57_19825 [Phycisphaerae bacterium]|jgi:hypothetical protein
MRSGRTWLWIAIAATVVAGGAAIVWTVLPRPREFYTDADTIRQPVSAGDPRDILWQPPVSLSAALNTERQDYEPRLSWDGLTLYFVRGKAGENADLFMSQRTVDGWTEAVPVADINTGHDELGPEPSPDGTSLYFYSDRPGGSGGYDIWVAHRGSNGWQEPINLGPGVNSPYNDYGPALTPDGATVYFASNRPRPVLEETPDPHAWPATVREDLFRRTYDIYSAALTEAGAGPARPVGSLNTPDNEGAPCVSPAGDFVYFASDRPGGMGGFDLYRSRRMDGTHEPPIGLGAPVNTPMNELDPGLTHLGYALYFSSDRDRSRQQVGGEPDYNLYYTSAREVFTAAEPGTPVDWMALLRELLPLLGWLLLALILLLLLRAFWGSVRDRRLALITQCLLASLLAHALLMLLLSFWQVTASLSGVLRHGRVQVVLATPGGAESLATQIRGGLVDLVLPPAETFTPERAEPAVTVEARTELAELPSASHVLDVPEQMVAESAAADAPVPEVDSAPPEIPPVTIALDRLPELALPSEVAKIAVEEAAPHTPATPAEAPLHERGRPVFATSQPTEPPVAAVVTPERGLAQNVAEERGSFADAGQPREATVGASVTPPLATTADVRPPVNIDVALPAADAPSATAEAASAPVPTPVAASPTRADPLRPTEAVTAPATVAALPPAQRVGVPESASAVAPSEKAIEVRPGAATAQSMAVRPTKPVAVQPLHLSLPELEQGQAAPVAEHAAQPAPATTEGVRAGVPSLVPATDQPARTCVKIDPRPVAKSWQESATPGVTATPRVADPVVSVTSTPAADDVARAVAVPLALDLELPKETEPPVRGGARQDGDQPPAGVIDGRVTDAATGEPLPGATLRLDLADAEPLIAVADDAGRFTLPVPRLPDFVALTASHDGYVPGAVNVPGRELRRGGLTQDFALEPLSDELVAVESEPVVHHLGNDRWAGRINSQFQKQAEGETWRALFELSPQHDLTAVRRAKITLLAKGVQCPHRLYINGALLDETLRTSPADGSFGEFEASFDPALLIEGFNTLEIQGVVCRGDLDDFEFVNVQVRLEQ